jgi:metal-responsive CopG/Arc/MetJ family transcriptional regulator
MENLDDKKYEKTRVNLYIPNAIIDEVDKLAKMYGANRSVMVSVMLKTYLDQQKVVDLAKLVPNVESK